MNLDMQVLLFCVCNLVSTVYSQFGSVSISVGLGGDNNADDVSSFKGSCPINTTCIPISSCPLLEDLLDFSCFSSDKYFHRLNELTCGNANNEDYVCCPSCDCGKVYQEGSEQCGQSMVRGVDYSGIGTHPWVARVGFTHKDTGNVRFACSGSIIGKKIVLTAAHCALAKPEGYKFPVWKECSGVDVSKPAYYKLVINSFGTGLKWNCDDDEESTIVVGEWDIGRSPDCNEFFCAPPTQAIKVDSVIVHPGYEKKIFRHDIALIILKEEIKYSVTAAPLCLSDKPEIVINERASLVGWGKLSGQNNLVSRQQQLEVPLVPLETCERIFGDSVPVHEGQLCAGGEEGRDACSGFGGAPLLIVRDAKHMQIGIVSFGSEDCGSEGIPSVYTSISHYYRWIVENSPSF